MNTLLVNFGGGLTGRLVSSKCTQWLWWVGVDLRIGHDRSTFGNQDAYGRPISK